MTAPAVGRYLIDSGNEDPAVNLRELQSEFYFEVGGEQRRLHAHGFISISHVGHYRLAVERVQAVCARVLGNKVHFSSMVSGDPTKAWQMYITKMQETQQVQL